MRVCIINHAGIETRGTFFGFFMISHTKKERESITVVKKFDSKILMNFDVSDNSVNRRYRALPSVVLPLVWCGSLERGASADIVLVI
ncbi:hypothetical protein AVEN_65541-1 [Araneus ventricosus]|uniref:Uncharacterized protein n=1 Tax=Araneus ventricosus TaxID=182803 RepID=A0A4Y2BJS9_ARAVE|nr:hypothetical protein AVEN_65541-1 [Araneus ventricosus]